MEGEVRRDRVSEWGERRFFSLFALARTLHFREETRERDFVLELHGTRDSDVSSLSREVDASPCESGAKRTTVIHLASSRSEDKTIHNNTTDFIMCFYDCTLG